MLSSVVLACARTKEQNRCTSTKEEESPLNIIIATTTYYRGLTETRFCLAEQMFREAREAGHIVVDVDGSPKSIVAENLRQTGASIYPQLVEGMGPSRRQVFYLAYEASLRFGCDIILWTEPEKVDLIRNIPKIIRSIQDGHADVVIPARSAKSWETWPAFQQKTEQEANAVYAQVTGLHGFDPMHGPVAFERKAARYFVLFDPTKYGVRDRYIQHYAAMVALSEGKQVISVDIDTCYPLTQKIEEEGNAGMNAKRTAQRDEISTDYRKMATILK